MLSSGRLSRLLKRRAVNGNKGVARVDESMPPSESPVYLPTEAHRSPADDWSDWTSFTLELEVHPTSGADGSSLRYCILLYRFIDTFPASFLHFFFPFFCFFFFSLFLCYSSGSTGRRNKSPNLCETLLGFVPGVTQSVDWHGEVSLRQRVIVDKLVPGGPLHQGFAHVQQGTTFALKINPPIPNKKKSLSCDCFCFQVV